MILKMFTIRDQKGDCFNTPFFQRTHGEAERNFQQLVRDGKSTLSQFPEDYDLYFLGDYDDQTGKVNVQDTPQHVAKAISFKQ